MASTTPVIDENTWARIVAKAYVDDSVHADPTFKTLLETDPIAAVRVARGAPDLPLINIPDPVRLMDLYYPYSTPANPDPIADLLTAIFQGDPTGNVLSEIYTNGTLFTKHVELPPGEWINPNGPIKHFEHAMGALSLADWMKIYAYIWHQIRFMGNVTIQEAFERDPAGTLNTSIVSHLTLSKTYTYKTTPLFTLGDPAPDASPLTLTNVRDALDAHNFRHRIRMSC